MNDAFPHALPPGTRVGAVVLERAIGQGAWGIVYEGQHDKWGHVAVKEYFPSTYASRASRGSVGSSAPQWQEAVRRGLERFGNEGRALTAIRHENVVPVYDYIEQDDVALLVMAFVEGETLTSAIAAGRFADPAAVIGLGATIVDTLVAIHAKNILHRDIAPDNIMIRPDGSPVLIDFGGAAAAVAVATRSTQNIVKDGYSPPEQYDTSANPTFPVGPWSDIYATAAVLYRVATGNEPAVSNARLLAAGMKSAADPLVPLTTVKPAGYSTQWLAAVDSGLALLPRDRPQSAVAWRALFERPAPVAAPRRNRLLAGATAAAVAVAAIVGGAFAFPHLFANTQPTAAPTTIAAAAKPAATKAPVAHKPVPHKPRVAHRAAPVTPPPVAQVPNQPYPVQPYVAPGYAAPAPQQPAPQQPVPQQPAPVPRRPVPSPRPAPRHAGQLALNDHAAPVASVAPSQTAAPATAAPVAPTPSAAPVVRVIPTATSTPQPTDPPATPAPTAPPATPPPAPRMKSITLACPAGFVWRQATASDHVCVTPDQRALTAQQNAMAASRLSQTDHTYGANTCAPGFVWRAAYDGDAVCVTPAERSAAAAENANAPTPIRRIVKRAPAL